MLALLPHVPGLICYLCTRSVPFGGIPVHWSRRGGRPPYRGQSDALAAPRLSSSVMPTPLDSHV
jgi:hypothetical protein